MITVEKHGDTTLLIFDDGKANALNDDSCGQLVKALEEAKDSKAVVITGGAKCFSAGLDVKKMPTLSREELGQMLGEFYKLLKTILDYPCPVVAAVNGHAIAGGAVVLLCCDLGIGAETEVKIGLSEVAVGMPLPGLVVELARNRLDPRRLNEAVLFGRLFSWEDAKDVGYLHATAPPEALLPTALKYAEKLSALPRASFWPTKKAFWSVLPDGLGSDAVGSFTTGEAKKHMSGFKG